MQGIYRYVLTNVEQALWTESWAVDDDTLPLNAGLAWRVEKRTLRGGLQDGVEHQAQVSGLGGVEDAGGAMENAGDLPVPQLALKRQRLLVGAHEDGDVAGLQVLALDGEPLVQEPRHVVRHGGGQESPELPLVVASRAFPRSLCRGGGQADSEGRQGSAARE